MTTMNPVQADYQLSTMSREDLSVTIDWAAAEGWNPGLDDVSLFYAADPQGFFVGKIGGQVIATISAVKYGDSFGFIGLYIADKNHRGRGYGIQVWNHALQYLDGRNIGLDGVLAQQDNYKKSGFRLAHRNIRFAGTAQRPAHPTDHLVDLRTVGANTLADYDCPFFPEKRAAFMAGWVNSPHAHAIGFQDNGRLKGYGVVRACRVGYKIGPLHAEDQVIALTLFAALTAKVPAGSAIFLDAPEPNAQALDMARRHGMTPCFETARMYTREFPDIPLDQIFGITTFELG